MSSYLRAIARRAARRVGRMEQPHEHGQDVEYGPHHEHQHLDTGLEPAEHLASAERKGPHDQPWVPTGGLIGRQRRSERRG